MYLQKTTANVDTGVYVVCDDKALMDRINSMLKGKGMIGIADAEGKIHYVVDGRDKPNNAACGVDQIVINNYRELEDDIPESLVAKTVREVLTEHGFDFSLIGTLAIFEIVKKMVRVRRIYFHGMKELMALAESVLSITYEQTERNVRYAVRKSSFKGKGVKTTVLLRLISDEVIARLTDTKKAIR